MKDLSPIILYVYDRPDHTRRTVEGLLTNPEAADSLLYIFADGPKPQATDDVLTRIRQTRTYIHTISGFRQVIIEESETNRGLAPSVIRGNTLVARKHGRFITVEDDIVATPYFLSYMNRCLERFQDDPRVWSIGSFNDTQVTTPRDDGPDVFLMNRPSSWGYATWADRWEKTLFDIPTLQRMFRDRQLRRNFDRYGGADLSRTMDNLFEGRNSSWAIRFVFSAFLRDAKAVFPNRSLVQNIGCDGTGTHSGLKNYQLQLMDREVILPDHVEFDPIRNKQMCRSYSRCPRTPRGMIGYVVRRIPPLYELCRKMGLAK